MRASSYLNNSKTILFADGLFVTHLILGGFAPANQVDEIAIDE